MTDTQIIDLYWARSEEAILATADTYGGYCAAIAWNILHSREDTEECVNDTWHRAWQSMPPERPNPLRVWLGKITRNLALDRWRASRAGPSTAPGRTAPTRRWAPAWWRSLPIGTGR